MNTNRVNGRLSPPIVAGQTNKPVGLRVVRLRNGDRLTAKIQSQKLAVLESNEKSFIDASEIVWLRTEDEPERRSAGLSDGRGVVIVVTAQELTLDLEIGKSVAVPLEAINAISGVNATETGFGTASMGKAGYDAEFKPPEGFVWVAPGELLMGSSTQEVGRDLDEGPQTRVTIAHGFWIAKTEVTQGDFLRVMEINPSLNTGDLTRPVERVTWFEATQYCARLTRQAEAEGKLPNGYYYRLPTEAEWEYACRAGSSTRFSFGEDKDESDLPQYAWFTRNSDSMTHPVGKKQPNPWGLFDMHGNVWEWCLDWWGASLPGGSVTNQPATVGGALRAARGGSWLYEARACRSANRDDYGANNRCGDLGFRIVLQPANARDEEPSGP